MRWCAFIRIICALFCALAVHAALVTSAVRYGWFSSDDTALPELDLTSVDLSFSETPDETATPVAQPPPSPVEPQPPTPPPPSLGPTPPPPAVELPPLPPVKPPTPPIIEHTSQPDLDSLLAEETPPDQTPPESQTEPQPIPDTPAQTQETPPPQQQTSAAAPQSAPAPSQARVKVDKQPSPRRRIKPEYPQGARQRGEEGNVTLELDILANGTVDGVRIVASCGFAELEQAAVQAAKRARFTPARRGSANVPSTARLNLSFRLKD